MVHFIPLWSFRNNVLPEHKGKWIHRWAVISVRQHVGGKVHSGSKSNIKYVRLHLLLCSGFPQKRSVESSCHNWCWRHQGNAALRSSASISGFSSDLASALSPLCHLSFMKGIWGNYKILSWLPTRGRLSWFSHEPWSWDHISHERFGDYSWYYIYIYIK